MPKTTSSRPIPRTKLAAALKRNMARRKAVGRGHAKGEDSPAPQEWVDSSPATPHAKGEAE